MVEDAPTAPRAPQPLHILGDECERADAARNRVKIIAATERLIAEHGIQNVGMDMIAREAGVGKGTLYRRFGDRAGLAHALLDDHAKAFQDATFRGAPPLGPGAPPADRLEAFLHGLLDLHVAYLDLVLVGELTVAGSRFRLGPYSMYATHVVMLLSQIDPRLAAEPIAHALLAPLSADVLAHQLRERGAAPAELKAALSSLVRGLSAAASS
jgi:AcrR family transcriptional regulator